MSAFQSSAISVQTKPSSCQKLDICTAPWHWPQRAGSPQWPQTPAPQPIYPASPLTPFSCLGEPRSPPSISWQTQREFMADVASRHQGGPSQPLWPREKPQLFTSFQISLSVGMPLVPLCPRGEDEVWWLRWQEIQSLWFVKIFCCYC